MGEKDVIARLPEAWQTFFRYLARDLMKAELIYNDMMFSQYGSHPRWTDLFKSLSIEDPCIEEDKMVFKPRLQLLSDRVQDQFFQFLLTRNTRIPDADIKPFIGMVAKQYNSESPVYDSLLQLAKKTMVLVEKPEIRRHVVNSKDLENLTDDSCKATQDETEPVLVDEVIIIEDDEDIEQPAKRPRLDFEGTVPVAEDVYKPNADAVTEAKDVHKPNADAVTEEQTNEEETEVGNSEVSQDMLDLARTLKEIWSNNGSESPVKPLTELSTLTVTGIQTVCQCVDFPTMGDDVILTISEHLTEMWESFSSTAIGCLLYNLLYQRVRKLTQKASRQLMNAVTLTAGKFQKQFIDAVMLPCFMGKPALSSFMCDVFVTVIKESLNPGSRLYFLQQLVAVCNELTENCFGMLQCIVDSGCDFDEVVFQNVLELIQELGLKYAKDLKVGKLLLSVVNKHGKDMKNRHLLEKIVNNHNTFLKKTIIASLKKMKS